MKTWRASLSLLISLVLIFPPTVVASERPETAAAQTRSKFESTKDKILAYGYDGFEKYGPDAPRMAALLTVKLKFSQSPWAKFIQWHSVDTFVKSWIFSMLLSRDGFHDVAIEVLLDGIASSAVELSPIIRKRAADGFNEEEANLMLAQLLNWTVETTISEFGLSKRYELERVFLGLREAAKKINSKEFEDRLRQQFGTEVANSNGIKGTAVSTSLAIFVSLFMGSLIGADRSGLLQTMVNNYGTAALFGMAIGSVILSGLAAVGGACAVQQAGHLYGACRAKINNLKPLARRCSEMLTSSGEIIP